MLPVLVEILCSVVVLERQTGWPRHPDGCVIIAKHCGLTKCRDCSSLVEIAQGDYMLVFQLMLTYSTEKILSCLLLQQNCEPVGESVYTRSLYQFFEDELPANKTELRGKGFPFVDRLFYNKCQTACSISCVTALFWCILMNNISSASKPPCLWSHLCC